jgi:hypothetical protein
MTTKLSYKEFQSRLTNLTRIGEPVIMGTPFAIFTTFDFSGKPFYGEFNETEFILTRNKVMPFPTGYIIKGTYNANIEAKLIYEVKPISFSYYWIRIAPIVFFVFINTILFFNLRSFQLDVVLTVNAFLLVGTLLVIAVDKFQKKSLEKRFCKEFEIE